MFRKLTGIIIGLSGALSLILFGQTTTGDGATTWADVLIGGNCLCWATFLVLVKDLSKGYGPLSLGCRLFWVGSVLVAPFCLPSVLAYVPHLTAAQLGYVAFIVLVPTVIAYVLNQLAVRHLDASVVATHWYLLPVFGILGAALRLNEPLRPAVVLFALLTCAGVLISAAPARPPPATSLITLQPCKPPDPP